METRDPDSALLDVPEQALHLRSECQPEFILETDDKGKQRRKIKALFASGKKIARHWGWNNLYIDLDSVKVTKKQLPLLLNHDQRIGVVTAKRESDGFIAEGYLLQNDQAAQVAQDAADGFPWQCSCWLQPARVEEVMEGASVNVNGTTVDGPAWVWRDCWLREVTLTELGADENTKAEIMAQGKSLRVPVTTVNGENMADPKDGQKLTVELLSQQHPDLVKTVRDQAFAAGRAEGLTAGSDEATKIERERCSRIAKRATSSQLALVQKFVTEGKDADAATDELLEDPRRNANERRGELEAASPPVTPASAGGKSTEDKTPETVEARAKREFAASKDLQAKFGNEETYLWHLKAVAAGAVKEN